MDELLNHMAEFSLDEISFVESPMQELARAEITKRREITNKQEVAMSEATQATEPAEAVEKLQERVAAMDEKFSKYVAISELSGAEKTHYDGLSEADQAGFLSATAEQRAAELTAKAAAEQADDPVMFEGVDGIRVLKSQGPEFLSMAKNLDALTRKAARLEQEQVDATFRKRAEGDFAGLPGSVDTRVALLKAVESIDADDVKEQALQMLKAHADSFSEMEGTLGMSGEDFRTESISSAHDELERLAKAHQVAHPDKSYAKAYQEITRTQQGRELLQRHYAELRENM